MARWRGAAVVLTAWLAAGCAGSTTGIGLYQFHGQVIEAGTGRPITGARVTLEDPGVRVNIQGRVQGAAAMADTAGASTNAEGRFEFGYRFEWRGPVWILPPLFLVGIYPRLPPPDRLTLLIEGAAFEPELRSLHSSPFTYYLTTLVVDQATHTIHEAHRVEAEGYFSGPTGYRIERFRRSAPDGDDGYLVTLPTIEMRRQ